MKKTITIILCMILIVLMCVGMYFLLKDRETTIQEGTTPDIQEEKFVIGQREALYTE